MAVFVIIYILRKMAQKLLLMVIIILYLKFKFFFNLSQTKLYKYNM